MEGRRTGELKISQVIPYECINNENWSVNSLIINVNVNFSKRPFLNNIVEFNKKKLNPEEILSEKNYPYIELRSISQETGLITEYKEYKGVDLPTRAKLIAKTGDILLSTIRPERGVVAIVPPELDGCIVSSGFVVLSPKKKAAISSEALYFTFRSDKVKQELGLMTTGSTTPTVTLKNLKQYSIPIKSLTESDKQQASMLYSVWYEKNKTQLSIQEAADCVFSEELHKGNIGIEEKRSNFIILDYEKLQEQLNISYYINLNDSEIEWSVEQKSLHNLTKIKLGATASPNEYVDQNNSISSYTPYIRIKNLTDNQLYISTDDFTFLNEEATKKYEKYKVVKGDIVLARVGGTLGKSALVQDSIEGSVLSQHLISLSCYDDIIPEYFLLYLKTSWARKHLQAMAVGTAQSFIKLDVLKEMPIPLPDKELQQKIVELITERALDNGLDSLKKRIFNFCNELTNVEDAYH